MTVRPVRRVVERAEPLRPRAGYPFGTWRIRERRGTRVVTPYGVYLCGESHGPNDALTWWTERIA